MSVRANKNSGTVLGLDIGGANLKAASADGQAVSVPFPLWREPQNLAKRLRAIVRQFLPERLAVTMTGELCDCFATKRQGVHAILDAVEKAAPQTPIQVWSTRGCLLRVVEAHAHPLRVAAANWHALATFAGRWAPKGAALLIDVGSTTTDIIPLWQGKPASKGLTDSERLDNRELVYTGVRRTPLCALMTVGAAREIFATTHDVYLVLKKIPEEPDNRDTADGRPATRACAHARLARMRCDDADHFLMGQAIRFANDAHRRQAHELADAIQKVSASLRAPPAAMLLSGVGEFLAHTALRATATPRGYEVLSFAKKRSSTLSAAACAYALAVLAEESWQR